MRVHKIDPYLLFLFEIELKLILLALLPAFIKRLLYFTRIILDTLKCRFHFLNNSKNSIFLCAF